MYTSAQDTADTQYVVWVSVDGLASPAFLVSAGTSLLAELLVLPLLFFSLLKDTKASLQSPSPLLGPKHYDSITCPCNHYIQQNE